MFVPNEDAKKAQKEALETAFETLRKSKPQLPSPYHQASNTEDFIETDRLEEMLNIFDKKYKNYVYIHITATRHQLFCDLRFLSYRFF